MTVVVMLRSAQIFLHVIYKPLPNTLLLKR